MLTPNDARRQLIETIARLHHAGHNIHTATHELRTLQSAYPTNTTGTGTTPRLNDDGTPPGLDRHLFRQDQPTQDLHRLTQLLRALLSTSAELQSLCTRYTTTTDPNDDDTQQRVGEGDCQACGRYCTGQADNDRLRSNLCDACRTHHRRWTQANPTLDRGEWLLHRRRSLTRTDQGATP